MARTSCKVCGALQQEVGAPCSACGAVMTGKSLFELHYSAGIHGVPQMRTSDDLPGSAADVQQGPQAVDLGAPLITWVAPNFRALMEEVVIPFHEECPGSDLLDPLERDEDPAVFARFRHGGRTWLITRSTRFDTAWIAYCDILRPGDSDPFVVAATPARASLDLRDDLRASYPIPLKHFYAYEEVVGT